MECLRIPSRMFCLVARIPRYCCPACIGGFGTQIRPAKLPERLIMATVLSLQVMMVNGGTVMVNGGTEIGGIVVIGW